jgi:hypothetical protein
MAFIDSILEFWDAKALTGAEESRSTGNILDMETDGATDAKMGFLWWNLLVSTAEDGTMTSGGYFQLVTSDSATFATGSGGEQVIGSFGSGQDPLFAAQLVAGARFSLAVPLRVLHKYVEVEFIIISQSAGSLVIDSWMGMEPLSPLNTQKEPT